ncbi:MAG: hypothetical protein ACREVE_11585 [Gammaproteobacteria bacterium]
MRRLTASKASGAFLYVFGAPLLLALASAFGLVSALLGDGIWDVLSWFALGAPVLLIVWYTARSTDSEPTGL